MHYTWQNTVNVPVKRHRVAEWIRKHNPHICFAVYKIDTQLRTKDKHRLKVKGWKKSSKQIDNHKKAGVAIPITYIIIFPSKIWAKKCALYTAKHGIYV